MDWLLEFTVRNFTFERGVLVRQPCIPRDGKGQMQSNHWRV